MVVREYVRKKDDGKPRECYGKPKRRTTVPDHRIAITYSMSVDSLTTPYCRSARRYASEIQMLRRFAACFPGAATLVPDYATQTQQRAER